MDLWQLKIFVSVVDNQSFSKASEAVNISQPTVSSHIRELEEYFNCRLLDRLGKRSEPTRAGRILYEYANRLLAIKEDAESAIFDFLGHIQGELIIGGSTIPAGYILPGIISSFVVASPNVSVILNTGDTDHIITAVRKGQLDLGVVGAKTDDPDIIQEKLVADEMKLIVPPTHEWAGCTSIPCDLLADQNFVLREKGSGTWQSIAASFKEAGADPKLITGNITMGSSIAVIQGVLNGLGVSILSTIAAEEYIKAKRLFALSVEGLNLSRFFYMTFHIKRSRSPLCLKFVECARRIFSVYPFVDK